MQRLRAFDTHIAPRTATGTRAAYGAAVKRFNVFLEMESIPYDALPANVLVRFAAQLAASLSPSSVNVYVKGVKQYLEFLRREGVLIPAFPSSGTRARDVTPAARPRTLTDAHLDTFALFAAKAPDPYRTLLLLQTIVPAPLGPLTNAEASALQVVQRRGLTPAAWITLALRGRVRRVPVVPVALPILSRYLRRVRPALGSSTWLWPAPWADYRPVKPGGVRGYYEQFRAETGLTVTAQQLYRTALARLAQAGLDAAALAQITGTTARLAMDLPVETVSPSWDVVYQIASRAEAPWLKGLS